MYKIFRKYLNYIFVCFLFSFVFITIFLVKGERFSFRLDLLFFAISVFSIFNIFFFKKNQNLYLHRVFFIFTLFFFGLAPIIQFKNKSHYFTSYVLSEDQYFRYGLLYLLIIILYFILYKFTAGFFLKQNLKKNIGILSNYTISKVNFLSIAYSLNILSIILFLYLIKYEFSLLIFRPFVYNLKENTNLGSVGYSLILILRNLPFILIVYYKLIFKSHDKHLYFLIIFGLMLSFPTSLSRTMLAILYLPIFLIFSKVKNLRFSWFLIFNVLIVFPLWNSFRYFKEKKYNIDYKLFESAHFDAFQNYALLVESNFVTNGKQLLGSLLFFLPNKIGNFEKPLPTGKIVANLYQYFYNNISMPFFAEGYSNFGYAGIILFILIIAVFNSFFDNLTNDINIFFKSLSMFLIGWEFFLLRGDLATSVKILASLIVGLCLVHFICSRLSLKFKV